ncbi:hypothetical protein Ga0609869_002057 [Rhodovulum iodosum]|uniref:Secreted protein n=1 Tax=Rhodovulum iodosum TaxID=68291 RepID=A0ABV3XUD9_9RHOB|nr:hypothetical protein [Rhodovulum robiginosum]RSK32144.1 hypothetical protein EJA01_13050 [Rhodovulum robiginosum]
MKSFSFALATASTAVTLGVASPAIADEQAAIDGCIDRLRAEGGPDAQAGGEILSSEFSEAGTLVMLRDAGGTVWRCIGYNDGTVGELTVAQAADDGGGAMAGASSEPATTTVQVRFDAGTSGAELTGTLSPGSSTRYVLGANNGQNLYVRVATDTDGVFYQIFNPDGSFLLEQMTPDREYRGELWQSGDHVVEVINRGNGTAGYNVIFGID